MNPLLGRLYQQKSRSKTKYSLPTNEDRRNQSLDRALVPKVGHKVKL